MDWMPLPHLQAELEAALLNVKHMAVMAEQVPAEYQHLYQMQGLCWEMRAEDLQQRIDDYGKGDE